MPSKKHRPIVMHRNQKPSRTSSIIKSALWITAILAVIEIIILFVIHKKNTTQPAENKPVVIATELKNKKPESIKTINKKDIPLSDVKNIQKDTVEIKKPLLKTNVSAGQLVKDTAVVNENKRKEAKVVKPVDSNKMFQILNEVRLEKLQANNPTKCISIQIINNSNAENGFMIANYLRKNGYVISGREVVTGSQKGIQIDAGGTCIKLSVGDLN